jgi:hypothetical protein
MVIRKVSEGECEVAFQKVSRKYIIYCKICM